ncbi:MAG: nickel-dependent lactate racemase [Desulfomonile tiedjei]|nr:nickel-dependent lactate racemase [Desulfomonile tiedjei]
MDHIVELPWGTAVLPVRIPETWRVLGELKPRSLDAPPNLEEAVAKALASPIGAEKLGSRDLSGRKVVLVMDDHSRPTPVREFINPVLAELAAARVREQDIDILIATGVHRASRTEEVERKLGGDIMNRFGWRCHDAYDANGLADLGTTSRGTHAFLNKLLLEADLIVCLGALEPHLLAGFGGGLKMLLPGCAGAETIGTNHLQGVDPDHFDYVGQRADNSPMRLDLEEVAGLLRREVFIVNAAMNEQARPTRFFCGDPIQAHRAGEAFVQELVRLDVPEQADAVLTNSFPMDLDLRQSVKCLGNSLWASKPGGVMMGCIRCEHGLGEIPLAKKTLPYTVTRTLLKVIGKHRVLPLVKKVKQGEPVEEVFIGHFGLQMLRRNHLAVFSDSPKLPPDIGRKMGLCRSYTAVQEMISWAASKAPRQATLWVLPCGGSTYASFQNGQMG